MRPLLYALVFALILATAVFTRSLVESKRCLTLGQASVTDGETNSAILHFRHALEWYTPIGGGSEAALAQLIAIGDRRAEAGDLQTALFAYRSAKVGIMAIRHLWIPYSDEIPNLNRRIARLMSLQTAKPHPPGTSYELRYAKQLNSYKTRQPTPVFGFLAGSIFAIWLSSLGLLVVKGFDKRGKPRRSLRYLIPVSFLLLFSWLISLRIA